jgi:hypothetical protein
MGLECGTFDAYQTGIRESWEGIVLGLAQRIGNLLHKILDISESRPVPRNSRLMSILDLLP